MTTSNCMTCIYGGSWCGEISTGPGHCYMFKDEPEGVCGQWRTSIAPPATGERAELIHWLRERSMWDGVLRLIDAASMLEADAQEIAATVRQVEILSDELSKCSKAQQVAVPVTKTRVGNYLCRHESGDNTMFRNGFKDGVKFAEAHHGITAKPSHTDWSAA